MQDEKKRLQRWFLTSSRTMATGSYGPIILGVLVMPELIPLLFGPKWEPAVLPTQLLALVSMRQMTMMLIGPLFQALGKTKEQFYWTIVAVAATVVGIVIGLQWGIVGVAAGVTISMYLLAPLQIAVAARMVGFRGSEYTRALAPAWIAAAAMVVVWIPARTVCSAVGIPALVAATLCGLLSLAAYVLTLRFGFKELYDSMHEVALMLVRRKGGRRRPRRITPAPTS
jgi:PST family polysaccharide transporter